MKSIKIKKIIIGNYSVSVNIKSVTRSKNIRIIVYKNGKIVLTKPSWVSFIKAEQFLEEKINWIQTAFKKYNISLPLNYEKKKVADEHYKKNKEVARRIIEKRVAEINRLYNFTYNKISIRNQKTRWGSCSAQKNLNFNYRLAFIEKEALDYVIAHELCHLQEFNHSAKFWRLVEKASPNYKYWRKKLKNYEI